TAAASSSPPDPATRAEARRPSSCPAGSSPKIEIAISRRPCDGPDYPADFDGDGFVGILDFLDALCHFGPCP
ncbi:MAG: hypothetical protein ACYTAU_17490, partial [Planctomycetota bacterium]